jgi:hypothetical protein
MNVSHPDRPGPGDRLAAIGSAGILPRVDGRHVNPIGGLEGPPTGNIPNQLEGGLTFVPHLFGAGAAPISTGP